MAGPPRRSGDRSSKSSTINVALCKSSGAGESRSAMASWLIAFCARSVPARPRPMELTRAQSTKRYGRQRLPPRLKSSRIGASKALSKAVKSTGPLLLKYFLSHAAVARAGTDFLSSSSILFKSCWSIRHNLTRKKFFVNKKSTGRELINLAPFQYGSPSTSDGDGAKSAGRDDHTGRHHAPGPRGAATCSDQHHSK